VTFNADRVQKGTLTGASEIGLTVGPAERRETISRDVVPVDGVGKQVADQSPELVASATPTLRYEREWVAEHSTCLLWTVAVA
jgi:hypothetical protein